jgi:hypothetical protein
VNRSLLTAAFAIATVGTLTQSETADAGRYRFSGGGRVHARVYSPSVSVRYSRPSYRPYYSPRYSYGVSGRIYVGPRYSYYPRYYTPYPRYYYYYQPVPSYYGVYSQPTYYPVQPAATTAVVAPAPRPELPRFGIGLFAGGASVEGTDGFEAKESSDIGLLGRFRLTPGLLIEGEVGKQSYENDLRVDRRMGASLVYEIGAYNKLAPYVLAGLGVQQAEVDGQFETRQNFGELGIGLRYAATPHFHLLFDVRAGSRSTADSDDSRNGDAVTREISPPTEVSNDAENYTRARFAAVLYF